MENYQARKIVLFEVCNSMVTLAKQNVQILIRTMRKELQALMRSVTRSSGIPSEGVSDS